MSVTRGHKPLQIATLAILTSLGLAGCEHSTALAPASAPSPAHSAAAVTVAAGLEASVDLAAATRHLASHVEGWYAPVKMQAQPRSPSVLAPEDAAAVLGRIQQIEPRIQADLAGASFRTEVRVPFP